MSDGDMDSPEEWVEYQQNEIDDVHERIKARMGHVSGSVESGILTATHVQEHQNDRLEAYLEGYSDALEFAAYEVGQMKNLAQYAFDAGQRNAEETADILGDLDIEQALEEADIDAEELIAEFEEVSEE